VGEPLRSRLPATTGPGGLTSPDPVTAPPRPPGPPQPVPPATTSGQSRTKVSGRKNTPAIGLKISLPGQQPGAMSAEFTRWIQVKEADQARPWTGGGARHFLPSRHGHTIKATSTILPPSAVPNPLSPCPDHGSWNSRMAVIAPRLYD
jgi:hypothetical protein